MRLLLSLLGFALTLLLALFIFTYAALHYRLTMGEMMQALQRFQNQVGGQGAFGDFRAVIEIALQSELIAFIAISLLVKLGIEVLLTLFGAGERAIAYPGQSGHSPFNRWGREES